MFQELYRMRDGGQGPCYDEFGNVIPCPGEPSDVQPEMEQEPIVSEETVQEWTQQPPWPKTLKPVIQSEEERPLGATGVIEEFTGKKLFDINNMIIDGWQKTHDELDSSYLFSLFNAFPDRRPIVDGKEINTSDLNNYLSNPTTKKQLLDQAKDLENLPEFELLDPEKQWEIHDYKLKSTAVAGKILQGNKVIANNMYNSAVETDASFNYRLNRKGISQSEYEKNVPVSYTSLFDKDKNLIDKEDWVINTLNTLIDKDNAERRERYEKVSGRPTSTYDAYLRKKAQGTIPGTFPSGVYAATNDPSSPYYKKESVLAKPSAQEMGANIMAEYRQPFVPSQNVTRKTYQRANVKGHTANTLRNLYDDYIANIYQKYNDPATKGVNKITTAMNPFDPFSTPLGNQGGVYQAVPLQISFDSKSAFDEDNNFKPEMLEFSNLISMVVNNQDKIKANIGKPSGLMPGESKWESIGNILLAPVEVMSTGSFPGIRSKNVEFEEGTQFMEKLSELLSTESMPAFSGSIQFQDVAAGDMKYHAYTLKLSPTFAKKILGTKENPGVGFNKSKEIINDGITFYVPADVSENYEFEDQNGNKVSGFFGKYSAKSKDISSAEGLLSIGKQFEYNIPGAGSLTVKQNPKGDSVIVGVQHVAFNTEKMKYDTFPGKESTIPYDRQFDVDDLVRTWYNESRARFLQNKRVKKLITEASSQ